jgi:uracil-DNA glycosylase family 4
MTPQSQLLKIQPVLDAFTECGRCELAGQKSRKQSCYAHIPKKAFNGLMVVGEGPGRNEVVEGRPFVGRSGQLLRALCQAENVDLDACYITNATLCKPESDVSDKGPLYERFPTAIHACLPRLEEEIARVRPRVILALGAVAMAALTGEEEKFIKRAAFTCEHCASEDRKVVGVQCAKGDCKHIWQAPYTDEAHDISFWSANRPMRCPKCDCDWKRLKVRRVACPKCLGLKMRSVEAVRFDWDYNLTEIAGAIIPAEKFGWDKYGVKYVLATYHPSFLLHAAKSAGSGEKKVMAGQFAAKSVQRHIRKANVLLREDRDWSCDFEVTSNQDQDAADHLHEYIYDGWHLSSPFTSDGNPGPHPCPYNFAADIETEAWGAVYVCRKCTKKSGIERPVGESGWGPKEKAALWVRLHAEILEHGWCKECNEHTVQDATLGELDAREIENVSNVKVLGFASRKRGHALVVDTRWIAESPALKASLGDVLSDARISKTFQNGAYDITVIRKLWAIKVAGYTDDTLNAHHVACPDESHSLSHMGFKYTFARVWKPPKKLKGRLAHESFEDLCLYNARDCMVTDDVRECLAAERVRKGNSEAVYRLDMKLQRQALAMHWNGMAIDYDAAREVGRKAIDQRNEGLALMREIARDPNFNPNSPEQLRHVLFDQLGMPVIAWTNGGQSGNKQASTAKEVLLRLDDTPFKRGLLLYKDGYDILKQYFDISRGVAIPGRNIRIWADGRMHASWQPLARSGRWTSSPNFQNWPGWMRKMIVAPKGRKIVGADYDQLELRIVAALANDPVLIRMCLTADDKRKLEPECDPHSFVAQLAFGETYTKLSLKDPNHNPAKDVRCKCETCTRKAYRDICKRVIYGLNYGAGEQTVLEAIYNGGYYGPPLKLEMLTRIKHAIYKAFARIPEWRDETYRKALEEQAIFSALLKRWRTFPLGDVSPTEISNFPIQSSGADIMNIRNTLFIEEYMLQIDPTAMFLAQVHDAVYYEVDEDRSEPFQERLTDTLTWETELVPGGQKMKYTAGAQISDNWKEAA